MNTLTSSSKNHSLNLTIFGASRGVGLQLAQAALLRGHRVTTLLRDPARLSLEHPNLTTITGDAMKATDVKKAVEGADAVFCALGASAFSASKVRSQGTQNIVRAMKEANVTRLIAVSLLGAKESREGLTPFLKYVFFPLYLRRAVKEHEQQETIIERSETDWTILRPPHLTDGPATGDYVYGFGNEETRLTYKISRADLADFALKQLETQANMKRAVGLSYRTTSKPVVAPSIQQR